MSGVQTGPHSEFKVVNNITGPTGPSYEELQKQYSGILIIIFIFIIAGGTLLSRALQHDPDVEKWMGVSATLDMFVPDDKKDYYEATNESQNLQKELETAQKELSLTADMLNILPPEDQTRIADLQQRIGLARERQKREFDHIISFLIYSLKSGNLVAKGYDQRKQLWECPLYSDWNNLQLSGGLTDASMSIRGGVSGRVILGQVQFGKPLATAGGAGPNRLCRRSGDSSLGS
jgi:hypothetical protein